jgi:hypothetical protein
MVKTKNNTIHLPLVVTGYILFGLLAITTFISTTIPFGILLLNPYVIHDNVAVTVAALTLGAVLPVLAGYIIGGRAVRSKNSLSHHFNGMLFGLLGYWVMTFVGLFVIPAEFLMEDFKARLIVMNVVPAVLVAVVSAVLAIWHVRSHQSSKDVIEFKPFSVVLIVALLALPVWTLVLNVLSGSINGYSVVSLAAPVLIGAIVLFTLRKTRLSRYQKVVWTAISLSVAFVMSYVFSQLTHTFASHLGVAPTVEAQTGVGIVGTALAIGGWIIYWRIQVKSLR